MNRTPHARALVSRILALGLCGIVCGAGLAQSVIIDNSDAGFAIVSGSWNTGAYGQPHGANYNWALTTAAGESPAAVAWQPDFPTAGAYEVAIWYVQGTNRAEDAPFTVYHAGGQTTVLVDQSTGGETWHPLGTFTFDAGENGYVTLHNDAGLSVVIADAVRFTPVGVTVELTMEVAPTGTGATLPADGGTYTYYLNENVPIFATAEPGYEFHNWAVSGGADVANPWAASTTVIMDQDKTITAVFVEEGPVEPEFRGFWADAFHIGFKSQSQINDMIARAVAGNYNAILPEVMAFQDTGASGHGAYWNSDILPRASDISGSFDPLAYLVTQAHAAGLEVHPWLVAFRVCSSWPPTGNPTVTAHPEWLMVLPGDMGGGPSKIDSYYVLDPGSAGAQDYLMSIVREIVTNYDVDGIHWDYIRYTNEDAGYPAYTWYEESGLQRFKNITGYSGTPPSGYGPWEDFRRRGVTEVVRRAQVVMATADNPRQPLRQTAALITWGNAPSNFENTSSWRLYQNWEYWQDEGYLDAGIPMTYYDYDVYPSWYRNWVDQSLVWRHDRHIFTGPGIYLNDFADSVTEIQYAQNAGVNGICTYSYVGTSSGGTDWSWYPHAASTVFLEPAPIPVMPWRNPATATEGYLYGRAVDGETGLPLDNATIRINGFLAGQTDGNGFYVVTQVPAGATGSQVAVSVSAAGFAEVTRPAVLVQRAGYTEANFALGDWLLGDYDVDLDVDVDDLDELAPRLTGPDNGFPPAGGDLFDFDLDNDVDLFDFAEFQTAFTG